MPDFIKKNPGIDTLAVVVAIPGGERICGIKYPVAPAVENFKRQKLLNRKRIADPIGVIQSVVVWSECLGQVNGFTIQQVRVDGIDADGISCGAVGEEVRHLDGIIINALFNGGDAWVGYKYR